MSDYRKIEIAGFNYDLPEERIARYPLHERDLSSLLVWQNGEINIDVFKNIDQYLPAGSMLVFNNTRVIHARMLFRKATGAKIEIFCLEPVMPADYQQSFQQAGSVVWECLTGNAKKWKDEELKKTIFVRGDAVELKARKVGQISNTFLIEFSWPTGYTFAEIIEEAGTLPLPPYLNRESEPEDEKSYQTIYASAEGSVAAPTAGLHFTEDVFTSISQNNISLREITLHVGAGTFQPVKSKTIKDHSMHQETVVIPRSFIEELAGNPRKIIAVGTTSVRSLESLYWIGMKMNTCDLTPGNVEAGQWDPYDLDGSADARTAIQNVLNFLNRHNLGEFRFSTRIIIVPGYRFKLVEGIVTNFHQPQSTLLLLIAAFLGDDWQKVYKIALEKNFRFLSYGDSNLYLK